MDHDGSVSSPPLYHQHLLNDCHDGRRGGAQTLRGPAGHLKLSHLMILTRLEEEVWRKIGRVKSNTPAVEIYNYEYLSHVITLGFVMLMTRSMKPSCSVTRRTDTLYSPYFCTPLVLPSGQYWWHISCSEENMVIDNRRI